MAGREEGGGLSLLRFSEVRSVGIIRFVCVLLSHRQKSELIAGELGQGLKYFSSDPQKPHESTDVREGGVVAVCNSGPGRQSLGRPGANKKEVENPG